jgi:predicted metal-binding membrane protein
VAIFRKGARDGVRVLLGRLTLMAASAQSGSGAGLAPVYAAARTRVGLVAALFVVAGIGWAWTAREMRGMDAGPWTSLGSVGWFLAVWIVMMAAMMFPSVAPTVALYARITKERSPLRAWLFAGGYLLTWTAAGLVAYAVGVAATKIGGGTLAWHNAGRGLAACTLIVAAVYEVTPLKDVCLGKCRSPLVALLGSWRDGSSGAVRMGVKNGAWCVGCCWALMASLFALGAMSVSWMAFVAAIIAVEKMVPGRRRVVTYATAAVLLVLGILVLAVPDSLPALTIPSGETMQMG